MSTKPTPKREVTETAVQLLLWAQDDLLAVHPSTMLSRPRTTRTPLGPANPARVREQAALFRMVSIVEAFLDTLSRELMNEYLPNRTTVLSRLIEDFDETSTFTWDQRKKAYIRYHNISLTQCTAWNKISAAIEIRNSVAHSLGRVTPRQLRKARLSTTLSSIDSHVVNGEIVVGVKCLDLARQACIDFVKWVDSETP